MGKIESFRQLEAWQEAHRLVLIVYQVTKAFPSDERFGLVAQMRWAAISIPANIVEGFKRRGAVVSVRAPTAALPEDRSVRASLRLCDTADATLHATTQSQDRRRREVRPE